MVEKRKIIKFFIILFIFIFAIALRLWNLDKMGRTWDEPFYVESGYKFIDLAKKGDLFDPAWYKDESSNSPPLALYLIGLGSNLDVNRFDAFGNPIFNYDYTYSRLISVIFYSLTVVLVVIIGGRYISFFAGIVAGTILSMMPLSVGYSQLAVMESFVTFFFTATFFSFLNFLSNFSKKNIILTGILLGMALNVKYTNFLLIPLMLLTIFIWIFRNNKDKKNTKSYIKGILAIFTISLVTAFVIWPMPWFHLREVFIHNLGLRSSLYSVPEVFFGKLMLTPKIYYFVYFLITTPLLVLTFFIIGLKTIDFKRKWFLISIIIWFIFPFVQSFYNFRQHGIRYIIEIYAPLSLIAAIGFESIINSFTKRTLIKFICVIILAFYLLFILIKTTPYYLDYFNELVGGPRNIYNKKLFQMGWWGQGIKEAYYYLDKNAKLDSKVGIALSPSHVIPSLTKFDIKKYNASEKYDYIIVNYYNILREGFDDSNIRKKYKPVYFVTADGAILVTVYKR